MVEFKRPKQTVQVESRESKQENVERYFITKGTENLCLCTEHYFLNALSAKRGEEAYREHHH